MPVQVKTRRSSLVEHRNISCVAYSKKGFLQRYRIPYMQVPYLGLCHGHIEFVVSHDRASLCQNPYSIWPLPSRANARRAEWHCMFTATGFMVICVAANSTCTAKDVASPPRPCGPTPSLLTATDSSRSSSAPK